ncbi:MAG: M15 family metallopeptidase [bacterium]|nr:M15 family metallopeptidase [bacterium]
MNPDTPDKLKGFSPQARLLISLAVGIALIGMVGYGAYSYNLLQKEKTALLSELETTREKGYELLLQTRTQQATIDEFQSQILSLGNTVGTLEKLATTDEELLKKYSKVYFLSENYRPAKLSAIDHKYLFNKDDAYIHTQVLPYLETMVEIARGRDIDLLIASAFRSFDTQASLKSEYKIVYGAGTANQFSADQGYSEHQLGTAVDFTTTSVGGTSSSKFQTDPAYKWLLDNAYKYGFVLSYPEGNAYYKFEPWHWRFVGVELAKKLYVNKEYFYDLGQREIDVYLIKLFD